MGMVIVEEEVAVLGVNMGRGTDTVRGGDALFPNYFGENLLFSALRSVGALATSFQDCFISLNISTTRLMSVR